MQFVFAGQCILKHLYAVTAIPSFAGAGAVDEGTFGYVAFEMLVVAETIPRIGENEVQMHAGRRQ